MSYFGTAFNPMDNTVFPPLPPKPKFIKMKTLYKKLVKKNFNYIKKFLQIYIIITQNNKKEFHFYDKFQDQDIL